MIFKNPLCVAFNLLVCGHALGQATFAMLNDSPLDGVNAPIFDSQGIPLPGPRFVAELWGGSAADSLAPALDLDVSGGRLIVPIYSAGYFYSARSAYITSVAGGAYAWLQVRAWDTTLGSTYEAVVARGLGVDMGAPHCFMPEVEALGQIPRFPGC